MKILLILPAVFISIFILLVFLQPFIFVFLHFISEAGAGFLIWIIRFWDQKHEKQEAAASIKKSHEEYLIRQSQFEDLVQKNTAKEEARRLRVKKVFDSADSLDVDGPENGDIIGS